MPSIEPLESRDNPAPLVLTGTDGFDSWVVMDLGPAIGAIEVTRNGEFSTGWQIIPNADAVEIHAMGGPDTVLYRSARPGFIDLGDGPDYFFGADGAEGATAGSAFVYGGEGNDSITGGRSDDVIIGGGGSDRIDGGLGSDWIASGEAAIDQALAELWRDAEEPLSDRIISLQRQLCPADDNASDWLAKPRDGWDVTYNDSVRTLYFDPVISKRLAVATVEEFIDAVNCAQLGDEIDLAPGVYSLTSPIIKDLAGVTITGAGQGSTVLTGDVLQLRNGNKVEPTTIRNLSLDLTGVSARSSPYAGAYHQFRAGTFVLDRVEVAGIGNHNIAAILFTGGEAGTDVTVGRLIDCYLHDLAGDIVSTAGNAANGTDSRSIVEVYDCVGERPGPNRNNQVLTAHFGLPLVAIGGTYRDAESNVVAPDNLTRIDLWWVTLEAGNRSSSFYIPDRASIVYGCVIKDAYTIDVFGTLEASTITPKLVGYNNYSIQACNDAIIRNNHFLNLPRTTHWAVRCRDRVELVDNVFEGWEGKEWYAPYGSYGQVISGNVII